MGLKNGIEIEGGHPQRLKVGQFLPDPLKVAAKVIAAAHLSVGIRPPPRLSAPIGAQLPILRDIPLRLSACKETIRKYLVYKSSRKGCGRFHFRVADGELPVF